MDRPLARTFVVLLALGACRSAGDDVGGSARGLSDVLSDARGAPPSMNVDVARWRPAATPLLTSFGRAVDPNAPWPEYPRTQLVRERWKSLNGLWEFAPAREDEAPPVGRALAQQILVPFAMESSLSGVGAHHERAWYRRTFEVPGEWRDGEVLLHFEASDWETTVWLNGVELGAHRGGYERFSFDLAPHLRPAGPQELVVGVFDPTSRGDQPRGKQTLNPEGIWYTPTTGLWQSVWIEPVSPTHLELVSLAPSLAQASLDVGVAIRMAANAKPSAEIAVRAEGQEVARGTTDADGRTKLAIPSPRAWSPSDPFLYDVEIVVREGERVVDRATSYFGLRDVALRADARGVPRIELNGTPLFQIGVLDQGFWPDGVYTAPSDVALKSDIELAKKLGFNLIRKHVKVEPERWYTWCDRLGILVWQDIPSADDHRPADVEVLRNEIDEIVTQRSNHPSIVDWVVFNEGWGQFGANSGHADAEVLEEGTHALAQRVRALDPTRLVTEASGWTDVGGGDLHDVHIYPGPGMPESDGKRAAVLGEFGGLGLPIAGHTWDEKSWGYRGVADARALAFGYENLLRGVYELVDKGLCAAVYTQLTDVESECNGLVTYDRAVIKADVERIARANRGELPKLVTVVADGRSEAVEWSYTTESPAQGVAWWSREFDASAWTRGAAGFGAEGTPGAHVRTPWTSSDIWLRREIEVPSGGGELAFVVHHDEDCEIHVNGASEPIRLTGYTTSYELVPLPDDVKGVKLEAGKNTLAIHCHQTRGGQYIDVGVVRITRAP